MYTDCFTPDFKVFTEATREAYGIYCMGFLCFMIAIAFFTSNYNTKCSKSLGKKYWWKNGMIMSFIGITLFLVAHFDEAKIDWILQNSNVTIGSIDSLKINRGYRGSESMTHYYSYKVNGNKYFSNENIPPELAINTKKIFVFYHRFKPEFHLVDLTQKADTVKKLCVNGIN